MLIPIAGRVYDIILISEALPKVYNFEVSL